MMATVGHLEECTCRRGADHGLGRWRRLSAFAITILSLSLPLQARADEGERILSVGAGYSSFSVPDHVGYGAALVFDYERGYNQAIWLRASASLGGFYDEGDPAGLASGTIGLTYALDVLKYLPYFHLGVGGQYLYADEVSDSLLPFVQAGAGLDYLKSASRSYGVFARFESFLGRSAALIVGGRMSFRSGFF